MGRRGPRPQPTSIKVARGNPGKRRLNHDEPTPPPGAPPAPGWLNAGARMRWNEVAPQLEQLGVMTKIDGGALAAYCTVWARWKEAEEMIAKGGQLFKTPEKRDRKGRVISGGYPIQSPYIAIANKALAHVRGLEAEFGMTPSSRSRVKIEKGKAPADRQRARFFGVVGGKA